MTTPTPTKKLTKAERRILRTLATKPGLTASELAEACDLHRVYATRLVKKLITDRMIERRMALPTYVVTEQAQKEVDSFDNG